jgi:hypothetical protein
MSPHFRWVLCTALVSNAGANKCICWVFPSLMVHQYHSPSSLPRLCVCQLTLLSTPALADAVGHISFGLTAKTVRCCGIHHRANKIGRVLGTHKTVRYPEGKLATRQRKPYIRAFASDALHCRSRELVTYCQVAKVEST